MIWRCDLVPEYRELRNEIQAAVDRVLESGRPILGEECRLFEEEFAAYLGVKAAAAVASGTDGLTLTLMALGVGAGDEVITTPFTAIPTLAAIRDTGARAVFVDVREDTFLMDIEQVPAAITVRTRAIMPVHIFGNVVDIPRLRQVAGPDIPIVEDACQAHGSLLGGRKAGALGAAGVFSFYPTKNLGACGDGGAVVSDDERIIEQVRLLRMYGMVDKDHFVQHGVNSRLDEIQAAILRLKLKRLDAMNARRAAIARRYTAELRVDLFTPQAVPGGVVPNHHVYAGRVAHHRDRLVDHLESQGIQTNIYYPLPLYRQRGVLDLYPGESLPCVERLCGQVIALPMYPELPESSLTRIIEAINSFNPQ